MVDGVVNQYSKIAVPSTEIILQFCPELVILSIYLDLSF